MCLLLRLLKCMAIQQQNFKSNNQSPQLINVKSTCTTHQCKVLELHSLGHEISNFM